MNHHSGRVEIDDRCDKSIKRGLCVLFRDGCVMCTEYYEQASFPNMSSGTHGVSWFKRMVNIY